MKRQKLQITNPLKIEVTWYDYVRDTPVLEGGDGIYEGEVVGWRNSQVIVRVRGYAVIRFWKATGLEVGNADAARRGFRINLTELAESTRPAPGIEVDFKEPDEPADLVPPLPPAA